MSNPYRESVAAPVSKMQVVSYRIIVEPCLRSYIGVESDRWALELLGERLYTHRLLGIHIYPGARQ